MARQLHTQQVHYYRKAFALLDLPTGVEVDIATLPAGSIIQDAYVVVTTAFNSSVSDLLDMGTNADPNGFMSAVSVASAGKKSADDLATSDDLYSANEVTVSLTRTESGTAATAGALIAVILFIPNNDA